MTSRCHSRVQQQSRNRKLRIANHDGLIRAQASLSRQPSSLHTIVTAQRLHVQSSNTPTTTELHEQQDSELLQRYYYYARRTPPQATELWRRWIQRLAKVMAQRWCPLKVVRSFEPQTDKRALQLHVQRCVQSLLRRIFEPNVCWSTTPLRHNYLPSTNVAQFSV
eukprot:SAG31_NODE_3750_length_3923_cov_7.559100_4_plen_165_part_00